MKGRRVMHVITGLGRGGAEAMLYKLLARSTEINFQSTVVSLSDEGVYGEKIAALGVPVYGLGMLSGMSAPLALLRLRHLIREIDPVLLHAWMYHAGLAALVSAQGRPVILGIRHALHDMQGEARGTRVVIHLLAHTSHRAARIVYNSHESRLHHEQIGYSGRTAKVIPNGFDCEAFRPCPEARERVRRELGVPPEGIVIGHIGRFHAVKDHDSLLSAFAHLLRQRRHLLLVMAGSRVEPGNDRLMGRIERSGIRDHVRLLGAREDVPDLINAFDMLVNCSRSEAFSNVLGEAMACGVPCIATDVGDSRRILGEHGIVTPPRDVASLADAISRLAGMRAEDRTALGLRLRQRVVENFGIDRIAREHADLYDAVAVEAEKGVG